MWVLDILFGDHINIHMMAEIVRVDGAGIAFAFVQIPEDSRQALWTLLGGCADRTEP